MIIDLPSILFYVFAFVLIGAALAVITAKNPVHSVFFLILAFFNAAGLFVLLGAEYLAMTLVVVYVGAVAVLFLFVVMMLNINFEKFRTGFIRYLSLGLAIAAILFGELVTLLYSSLMKPVPLAPATTPIPPAEQVTNAGAIGAQLYTQYALLFELAGVILLVAMIGAIVLTLRHRFGVRKQQVSHQLARHAKDTLKVIKVKSGQGVSR